MQRIEYALILASRSSRRSDLLKMAGLSFQVIPSEIDESRVTLIEPVDYVKTLAQAKTNDVAHKYPDKWVLGADTIVLIDGHVLGKPTSKDDARQMLKRLCGKTHQVLTAYAIGCRKAGRFFSETISTEVEFMELSDTEIEWYIQTDEPYDKAGAYAIQGIGVFLVKRINGSYTNVVGLPVCEVVHALLREGVIHRHPLQSTRMN